MTATVQVLNATYESMSYTRLNRAVALVQRGEAVVEEAVPGRQLTNNSGSVLMLFPRVIRMLRYVKVHVRQGPDMYSKRGVLRRDNHICAYCGRTATTVDHIKPVSKGGARRDFMNTVASCQPCNNKKGARTPHEAHMPLQITPFIPSRAVSFTQVA